MVEGESRFADFLEALFVEWERIHGEPLRNAAVAKALAAVGYPLTVPYLSQLRSGVRSPSARTVTALATVFGVNADYFYTGIRPSLMRPAPDHSSEDHWIAARLHNRVLRRLLLAADGLSEVALARLIGTAELLRTVEDAFPDAQYQESLLPTWPGP
ncbi:helix-turn-helix domain-containing protein [Nocardia sp. CDC141]|uniref:Helix-turn-helix domain-containing protein n=1 Tax=Nocardia pulmonis TaxID=2951408 RepID=A0A9X2EDQ5_9NOCA|nr:helix-turn-helix transcriptional regulator [Nocardia sp. CDC159]MCM6778461.1 helix-turn-helix domain-containing protein [Nocardia pulmonis]